MGSGISFLPLLPASQPRDPDQEKGQTRTENGASQTDQQDLVQSLYRIVGEEDEYGKNYRQSHENDNSFTDRIHNKLLSNFRFTYDYRITVNL